MRPKQTTLSTTTPRTTTTAALALAESRSAESIRSSPNAVVYSFDNEYGQKTKVGVVLDSDDLTPGKIPKRVSQTLKNVTIHLKSSNGKQFHKVDDRFSIYLDASTISLSTSIQSEPSRPISGPRVDTSETPEPLRIIPLGTSRAKNIPAFNGHQVKKETDKFCGKTIYTYPRTFTKLRVSLTSLKS